MSLSPQAIKVVQETAPVVAQHAVEITKLFYQTMFTNNPEVLTFFNKSHQRTGDQPRALADAVIAYASHIQQLDALKPLVSRIAHRHVALSVKPEHYQIVHDNLMIAIGQVLGEAVTPTIGKAWSEAVQALAQVCIDAEEVLYQRNESRVGGWRYEREFELVSRMPVADDTTLLTFKPVDGYDGGFEFEMGQYLTVRCCDLKEAPRHYTIVSAPGENHLSICVRNLSHGAVSPFLTQTLKVHDRVLLGAPAGVYTPAGDDQSTAIFLSGGIGITPMVAMLPHFGPSRIKAAVHVEHKESRDALSDRLEKAGVPVERMYTEQTGRLHWPTQVQRLMMLGEDNTHFYLCGPPSFLKEGVQAFREHGLPEERLHYEVFGTGNVSTIRAKED